MATSAASATRWPTPALEGRDRAEPRRRVPPVARRRARRGDDPVRRPRPDRLSDRGARTTGAPGMPADLVTGEDADAVASYVAAVAGLPVRPQPEAEAAAAAGGGGRRGARRQGDLRRGGLRRLPHARGGGRERRRRPQPRRREAAEGARDRSRHERQGRDAVLQGLVLGGADPAVADYVVASTSGQ